MVWQLSQYPISSHIFPARSPRYVAFLLGAVKITIPNSSQEARISGGENGLFFAADTANISKLGTRNASHQGHEIAVGSDSGWNSTSS